jgi:riboflavin kinase/FMN adenylyltransferase
MVVYHPKTLRLPSSVLTIGALDGVHRGHQEIILRARNRARELRVPLVVYTMDPPPKVYFRHAIQLTSLQEKIRRLEMLGADYIIVASFDADYLLKGVKPFLDEIAELNPVEIWEGPDFRFGRGREGDLSALRERFAVRIVEPVCCRNGEIISSSRIRTLLVQNKLTQAEELLGWPLSKIELTK